MKFRTRFNVGEFERHDLVCETPSMTQQHFKDECDINTIIAKYQVTGVLGDPTDVRTPTYADVSNVGDFLAAQQLIANAQEQFDALPSNIRKRFDNNPALMLEFLQDESNREEAVKLGIVERTIDSDFGSSFSGSGDIHSDLVPAVDSKKDSGNL